MRKIIMIFMFFALTVFAQNVISGKELFEKSKLLNNKKVVIIGECIGDIIKYEDDIWVNIKTQDGYFIGVVLNKKEAEKIKYLGRYRVKGDIIKVVGIFHSNCPVHFGEMDIHSNKIEVLQRGEIYEEKIQKKKVFLSLILSFTILFFIYYFHRVAPKDSGE